MKTNVPDAFLKNKKLNLQELRSGKLLLKSCFTSLIATLNSSCNLRCIMCDLWHSNWSIPEKTFREIVDCLPFLEHIIWQGGEVFLSPYFSDMLLETSRYPYIEQRITTNALMINEKLAEKLALNNIELNCSIDGATKETYEYIRRGGSFSDLIKALEILKEVKKSKGGLKLRMNVVVMRSNYRELDKLMELAIKYDFENILLLDLKGTGEESIYLDTPENRKIALEIQATIKRLKEKAKQADLDLFDCLPFSFIGKKEPQSEEKMQLLMSANEEKECFCHLPWQQMIIGTFGLVQFGCWCPEFLGDISNNSLKDIWNSEAAQKYRSKIISGDYKNFCDMKCVKGSVPKNLRSIDDFEKKYGKQF